MEKQEKLDKLENIEYILPDEIEKRSFAIITEELAARGIVLPKDQEPVTKRVIHTSAAPPSWVSSRNTSSKDFVTVCISSTGILCSAMVLKISSLPSAPCFA